VVRIYLLLGNGVFSVCPPRDYINDTEPNQFRMIMGMRMRMRTRKERGLGGKGRRVWLKIDCELL
jgi:hypothetical protein